MLILFDIDGTLLITRKAGLLAMGDAATELFGEGFSFEGVDFAGRLDGNIWSAAAKKNGVEDTADNQRRFRQSYARHLESRFETEPTATLLPGVSELVDLIRADGGFVLGLLTGNYPETGRMKVRAAGLDPSIFSITAWGDDGESRDELPGVAMARYEAEFGRPIPPGEVVVIGDTPHDVGCARHHDCLSIAVATGPFHSRQDLLECGPDLAVDDLSDVGLVMDWLLGARSARG